MTAITVLLAEDHPLILDGLRTLLSLENDIRVVAAVQNGLEAVQLTGRHRPDVVVMDIAMPVLGGLAAMQQIRQNNPTTRMLILSSHRDQVYGEQAIARGASGYLVKQSHTHLLAEAIRAVFNGHSFFRALALKQFYQQHRQAA